MPSTGEKHHSPSRTSATTKSLLSMNTPSTPQARALASEKTTPSTIRSLGPYDMLERAGRGGMATVYSARDRRRLGVHRLVAVKVVHPHLAADDGFDAMFTDEARLASLVRHPNVCALLDIGQANNMRYLVMEYVCGSSFTQVRRELSPREGTRRGEVKRAALIAKMMMDASEGVQAVHDLVGTDGEQLNAVHRDVSPENLMVSCDGVVKLVDFGIARFNLQSHVTRTGMLKGKLSYVAPEILAGVEPDSRTDVWSLGVTAWELLTGDRLFSKDSEARTLQAVMEQKVLKPSEVRSELSPLYDVPIMRALNRDRTKRYGDVRSLGRDLREVSLRVGRGAETSDVQAWYGATFDHACKMRKWRGALDSLTPVTSCGDIETSEEEAAAVHVVNEPRDPSLLPTRRRLRTSTAALLGAAAIAAAVLVAPHLLEAPLSRAAPMMRIPAANPARLEASDAHRAAEGATIELRRADGSVVWSRPVALEASLDSPAVAPTPSARTPAAHWPPSVAPPRVDTPKGPDDVEF